MEKLKDISGYDSWRAFVLSRQGEQNESWRAEVKAILHARANGWNIKSITSTQNSGAEAIIERNGVTSHLEAAMITELPGFLSEITKVTNVLKQRVGKHISDGNAICLMSDLWDISNDQITKAVDFIQRGNNRFTSEDFDLLHGDKTALNQVANSCNKDFILITGAGTVTGEREISEKDRLIKRIKRVFKSKRNQHKAKGEPIYLFLYISAMPPVFDSLTDQVSIIIKEAAKRHFSWVVIQHDGSDKIHQISTVADGLLAESSMQTPP